MPTMSPHRWVGLGFDGMASRPLACDELPPESESTILSVDTSQKKATVCDIVVQSFDMNLKGEEGHSWQWTRETMRAALFILLYTLHITHTHTYMSLYLVLLEFWCTVRMCLFDR